MIKRLNLLLIVISITLLFVSIPISSAQTYSSINRFTDNVKLLFSSEDNKVKLALEIKEKEVNSALENIDNKNTEKAIKNLKKAQDKLEIIQNKISLKNSEEVKTSAEKINKKIDKDNLPEEFNQYKLKEEKTQLTAELTFKIYEYCKALAQENYSLMLKEEKCNPKTAQKGLEDELKELKDIQDKSFVKLMLDIRSCIDDPGTCNCDEVLDVEEKAKCEKLVTLAIKCEYKDDETACNELDSMKPTPRDGFAKSFIPNFLMNLFSNKHDMIEYNLSHSDGVPEECWDQNNKSECEQYDYLKETRLDWDEHGNFIGTNRARGIKEPIPTMQESIPQCYDKENNFLEEKCGKITIIRNEKGLVNYIIEKQIENITTKFEDNSKQNKMDINGKEGQTLINEIKKEINGLEEQIALRTFAPGTNGTGTPGKDIKDIVVEEGKSNGNNGLKPEIKTDIAEGRGNGDNGYKTEVKTYAPGDGTDENNLLEPDLNTINPDLYDPNARAPGDTIDDPDGPDSYAEGTNTIDP